MTRIIGVLLAALALLLGGCGGDDDDDAAQAPSTGPAAEQSSPGSATSGPTQAGEPASSEREDAGAEPDGGGSGDAERPSGTDAPSREQYIARADAICREAQAGVGAEARAIQRTVKALQRGKLSRSEYYRRTAAQSVRGAATAKRAVAELERLPKPSGAHPSLDAYLAAAAEQARLLGVQARRQRRGNAKEVLALGKRLARNARRTRAAAREFGFDTCGGA